MLSAFSGLPRKRLLLLFLLLGITAVAQSRRPATILPQTFSGWQIEPQSAKAATDPATVDAADAPVLKEYGFADSEAATYARNGRKMHIKAARFNDASGAFGAFSYYVQPSATRPPPTTPGSCFTKATFL
jgi:hypothetical protein